jgi:hypothetical protein
VQTDGQSGIAAIVLNTRVGLSQMDNRLKGTMFAAENACPLLDSRTELNE